MKLFLKALLDGQASLQSASDRAAIDSESDCPIGNAHRFVLMGQEMGCAPVALLIVLRGPSTVVFRVTSVIVDTLYRQARWAGTHIFNKCRELMPASAQSDAAPAISIETVRVLVQAPSFHRGPDAVFAGEPAVLCRAMRGGQGANGISLKTSAAARVSLRETTSGHEALLSAVAPTVPYDAGLLALLGCGEHDKSTESQPNEISGVGRCLGFGYSLVSHAVSSFVGDAVVRGRGALVTFLGSVSFYSIKLIEVLA